MKLLQTSIVAIALCCGASSFVFAQTSSKGAGETGGAEAPGAPNAASGGSRDSGHAMMHHHMMHSHHHMMMHHHHSTAHKSGM